MRTSSLYKMNLCNCIMCGKTQNIINFVEKCLNRSNRIPLVTPCFDGKELQIDCELVSTGLSAISVKGCDAGDPREEVGIRHRNSFWSVHRPELSKLSWASNYTPKYVENYLKIQAGNHFGNEEFEKPDILSENLDQLAVIHASSDQREDSDDSHLPTSKPRTTQLSDEDLASHTTLHKSRAEFCVTIGHLGEELFISDDPEPSGSKSGQENFERKNSLYRDIAENNVEFQSSDAEKEAVIKPEEMSPIKMQKNEDLTLRPETYDQVYENLNEQRRDGHLAHS